jgi:hypothetical protein
MGAWPQLAGPDGHVLAKVEDLAQAARQATASSDGPVALREACEAATVRILRGPLAVGQRRHTAMLVPTASGFHAVVDLGVWRRAKEGPPGRQRLRFVLAHELGHTFFYRPGRPPTRSRPADRLEERFCHRFATALLVPPSAAMKASLDPGGLYMLAGRFDVSPRVAAWAIARARPSVTLLWLRYAPHPVRGGQDAMRVQWGASERFVATGESFKSPLAELAPGEYGTSTEALLLAGRQEHVHIQAWRFANSMFVVLERTSATSDDAGLGQMALF